MLSGELGRLIWPLLWPQNQNPVLRHSTWVEYIFKGKSPGSKGVGIRRNQILISSFLSTVFKTACLPQISSKLFFWHKLRSALRKVRGFLSQCQGERARLQKDFSYSQCKLVERLKCLPQANNLSCELPQGQKNSNGGVGESTQPLGWNLSYILRVYVERKTLNTGEGKWLLKYWEKLHFLPQPLKRDVEMLERVQMFLCLSLKSAEMATAILQGWQCPWRQPWHSKDVTWAPTCSNAIQEASHQNHLEGFGCLAEGHEQCSYQHDQVGAHLALFSETSKHTNKV